MGKRVAHNKNYLYGPVPSRRLGLSLGIDIIPLKVCTLDCVYCQLGRTTEKTIERRDYVPIEAVLAELKDALKEGLEADFITISGSGEPTLNSRLGELIDGIKKITDIPVAVITNGTLLYREDVRADCTKADLVVPSLDAGDEATFRKVNRPHKDISIEKLVDGLVAFRKEFPGRIWLEVFLVEGLNTDIAEIDEIKELIKRIRPDKVQLNTAVRPTADPAIRKVDAEKLQTIARWIGEGCEVVADLPLHHNAERVHSRAEDILSMLKRRPCSLNDICSGLGINSNEALKHITDLQHRGLIDPEEKNGKTFFKAGSR
ncbi:MAG: radical SAM protein [Sedimentisphaerales bacterium]|nr:radical SAM protein [Sedimentisphaerales bacterium]